MSPSAAPKSKCKRCGCELSVFDSQFCFNCRRRNNGVELHRNATQDGIKKTAILSATALEYGVSIADLVRRCRMHQIAEARQVAMYLLRKHTKRSLPNIGKCFQRHHTTVLHAVRKIAERIEEGHKIITTVERIELRIAQDKRPL